MNNKGQPSAAPVANDDREALQDIGAEVRATDALAKRHRRNPRARCTATFMRSYAKLLATGLTHERASAMMHVSRETVWRWREQYPEFERVIQHEIAKAIHARLRVINLGIAAGDLQTCRWWLERTHGAEYASKAALGVQVNVGADAVTGVVFLPAKQIPN